MFEIVISRLGALGFMPRAEKVVSDSVTERILLFEMAILCIAPEILNCIAKAVESFFYERTPVFFIKFVFEIFSFV